MKRFLSNFALGLALLVVSGLIYLAQIFTFHRFQDTFFYMLQDFAFVPIQILLVTVIINELLQQREKNAMQHKMNMVIGAFFSELGNHLLKSFSEFDVNTDDMREVLVFGPDLSDKHYLLAKKYVKDHPYAIDCKQSSLDELKAFLVSKRVFLLGLLENPNLLEHESFTELLWAVCHLTEELELRQSLDNLTKPDSSHLALDIQRAYSAVLSEWLSYVKHLQEEYPYVFSLVLRTNPFDVNACVEVK